MRANKVDGGKNNGGMSQMRVALSAPGDLSSLVPDHDAEIGANRPLSDIPYQQLSDGKELCLKPSTPSMLHRVADQVKAYIPVFAWLPGYNVKESFQGDIISGITIGMICLAQTLAHAAIATTNAIQGPYCAFVPAIVYGFLGTSPHASVSSGAIAAILIADQVKHFGDEDDRTKIASLLALFSGLWLVLMGFCRMAFAMRFLSKPTLSGFITGGSLLIIASQMKTMLGYKSLPPSDNLFSTSYHLIQNYHQTDVVVLGLGTVLLLLSNSLKRLKVRATKCQTSNKHARWPGLVKPLCDMKEIFVVVVGVSFAYYTATPNGQPTMLTVGTIESGLPKFEPPWAPQVAQNLFADPHKLQRFVTGSLLVAFTTFLTTYATALQVAQKAEIKLDASQEMIALGAAGIAGGFFGAFPPSGSLSRTGLTYQLGVKTQLGGLVSAVVVGLGLQFLTPMLLYLPKCALAAIILNGTFALVDFDTPKRLLRFWKPLDQGGLRRDIVVWCVAFCFTIQFGVLAGITVAVLVSVGVIVADATLPKAVVLGCVESYGGIWRNVADWPQARTYPGLLVFEFRGPLSFASAECFRESVEQFLSEAKSMSGIPVRAVVLSFYSVFTIDTTALAMLEELLSNWQSRGICCFVANAKSQVRRLLESELATAEKPLFHQGNFMLNTADAVHQARRLIAAKQERAVAKKGRAPQQYSADSLYNNPARRIQRAFLQRRQSFMLTKALSERIL